MKDCTACKGQKIRALLGKSYPCRDCHGEGTFPEVDKEAIRVAIIASKGKNKGKPRAAFPSPLSEAPIPVKRAYYVWRMARYYGRMDVTMPMTALDLVNGDPDVKELDLRAQGIAQEFFVARIKEGKFWGF